VVRRLSRAVLTYFNLLMCAVTLGLALFAREIVTAMAAPEFEPAWHALPIIALGYVFWAIFQVTSTAFYLKEKTGKITVLVACAALLNLGLNALLVPRIGYLGAAWSTVITFATLAITTWIASERLMPIRPELGRLVTPIVFAAALYFASLFLPEWPTPAILAAKIVLVLMLPAALLASGYLATDEKAKIREIWRTFRRQ
jgi:O-antigen/teichoic acid export membrane protein